MRPDRRRALQRLVGGCMAVASSNALTAESALAGDILLGQSAPLTGPLAKTTTQFNQGALAWLKQVNDRGGIKGRAFRMQTLDDSGWAEQGEVNAKLLVAEHGAHALFGFMGASACLSCARIAEQEGVLFVAPVTGSSALREASLPSTFLMRPSHDDEVRQVVKHGATIGYKRIDLLFDYNAQGFSIRNSFEEACQHANILRHRSVSMARLDDDVRQAVARLSPSKSEAIILACSHAVSGAFIEAFRAAGFGGAFYALSTVDANRLVETITSQAVGVHFVQAVPYPWSKSRRVTADFLTFSQRHAIQPDFASLEGYLAARWLTHVVERTTKPAELKLAFQGAPPLELGGFRLALEPGLRSASRFVELATINRELRFIR
ncbi:ABC-type branched-subunit amino acid transport system substrate-binding protein [Hydrogenophaga palleronii]|uniref:ABC-type branched-subunit amino acid transport system substrate-binding protein n=1 Tax=Hydrogenophaga palleronii TaxID=65655 RepID=A0ABU1WLZ4_9BURK|nr:ABC transporter substrate-binding protein [Hydrogenophaga palleronii]MDR7150311.1 ABC-type branched-subunit amino acid transport system substrate-binding protein [Hydrogenophaga palleronii]